MIISLVRSLPEAQIDCEPDRRWLREYLGFVTDEHQINVALTRAKQGLCIIGKMHEYEHIFLNASLPAEKNRNHYHFDPLAFQEDNEN